MDESIKHTHFSLSCAQEALQTGAEIVLWFVATKAGTLSRVANCVCENSGNETDEDCCLIERHGEIWCLVS